MSTIEFKLTLDMDDSLEVNKSKCLQAAAWLRLRAQEIESSQNHSQYVTCWILGSYDLDGVTEIK